MRSLRNVAVVGFAQGPIVARDEHRTATEMLYPEVARALAACGTDRDAIDFQAAGSADYLDGRVFGFVGALDVLGAWPPRQDTHLEMDAAFAAYYMWLKMQAGECDTALVVGYGKASEGVPDRVLNLQLDPYYQAPVGLDPTSAAALQASAYMARSGATDRDFAELAARNLAAGARNPAAQVRNAPGASALQRTPWAVEPLRKGYIPPVGETAACLILAAEGKAERMCKRPVWICGVDQRAELQSIGSRDLSRSAGAELAARKAMAMAGMKSAAEADVVELSAANPAEEMILREALGLDPKGGVKPAVNPSGGPMAGNPLMATGLIRLGEIFLQLGGANPPHAVAGACRGIAHAAQGHCLQQNLFWVCGSERRWS